MIKKNLDILFFYKKFNMRSPLGSMVLLQTIRKMNVNPVGVKKNPPERIFHFFMFKKKSIRIYVSKAQVIETGTRDLLVKPWIDIALIDTFTSFQALKLKISLKALKLTTSWINSMLLIIWQFYILDRRITKATSVVMTVTIGKLSFLCSEYS